MPFRNKLPEQRFRRRTLILLLFVCATLPASLGLNSLQLAGHKAYPPQQIEQTLLSSAGGPLQPIPNSPMRTSTALWSNHNRAGDYMRALGLSVLAADGSEFLLGRRAGRCTGLIEQLWRLLS